MTTALSRYDEACKALAEVKDLSEVKDIADKAAAMKEYARRASDRNLELCAAELRIRAERRLGEGIKSLGLTAGRPTRNGFSKNPLPCFETLNENTVPSPTLAEMNIDKNLADRARKLASISEGDFETRLAHWAENAKRSAGRITVRLLRADHCSKRRGVVDAAIAEPLQASITAPKVRYGVILLDPEWLSNSISEANKCPMLSAQMRKLESWDARTMSADDSTLLVWANVPSLHVVLSLMSAWGFEYKSHCIWFKQQPETGLLFSEAHELLLVGVRGNISILEGPPWSSLIYDPIQRRSGRPEWQYELVESWFPHPPKLALTGPCARPGWDVWANGEIHRVRVPKLQKESGQQTKTNPRLRMTDWEFRNSCGVAIPIACSVVVRHEPEEARSSIGSHAPRGASAIG
jgi:N6-adenosine-specific RNA methylase IME4